MSMLTELDVSIPELAEIYYQHRWYPATQDGVDVENEIRDTLRSLLSTIKSHPENQGGIAGTMRILIEKDSGSNTATIYLQIGSVEW